MTKTIKTAPDGTLPPEALQELAAAAKACKIIAFPTDTVYGIGSTGLVKAALRRIYQIKARDAMKPLPILVKSKDEAKRWVEWTPAAEALAAKYWPGALTLVLKPTKEGRLLTFQEFPTLGIRVPAHPSIQALLAAADVPFASTSANLAGEPTLTTAADIERVLGAKIDYIIDAGPSAGRESTVVDATAAPRVLREGAIARDAVLGAASAA
ncbi:MAG: threonylcarbamoyl-AMP synthase [Elusimicrobia bacterium]|nr:threonylcarbamoyl-AMP synthase [Elusimicrobiota bacterium]